MYVCMYVCMYMCVCRYVYTYVSTYVCVYVHVYVFLKELSESQDNVDGGVEIEGSDEIVAKDDTLKKQG